jgi:hypothetical protein
MPKAAKALYELHMDAFLEGLAEVPTAEQYGLSKAEAQKSRGVIFAERLREQRNRKAS